MLSMYCYRGSARYLSTLDMLIYIKTSLIRTFSSRITTLMIREGVVNEKYKRGTQTKIS
jgi:hypothetical protein